MKLLRLLVPMLSAPAWAWNRECDVACVQYHSFKESLEQAKFTCEEDGDCPGIVDFSGNGGKHALCKSGAETRHWPKVCVEWKDHGEL
mmetsp:Transcript_80288/g.126699  ORF Transcript_80288/g.126699 Transcript_80288/m.126699 type:complete len:88 (+) Transcript_80288:10-273(+)